MILRKLHDTITDALKEISGETCAISITFPDHEEHGDLTTNAAMQLAGKIKKNPREVALHIQNALKQLPEVNTAEIAGPGFVNVTLNNSALTRELREIAANEAFGQLDIGKGKTVITEKSAPNIAKPMGVHHALSTILGQVIDELVLNAGYRLVRDNFIGDWGTQFGKLIYAIKHWGNRETIEKNPLDELLRLYVKFHDEEEKHSTLEAEGRHEFKKLEEGDPENRELHAWITELSLRDCHRIWDRLGTKFDVMNGEFFYEERMEPLIREGVKKGVIVEGEGGSLIIPMDDPDSPPCLIRKSDGATLYATRDLARIKYWEEAYQPDIGINVVDIAQKLHFQQIFEAAGKLQLTDAEMVHVSFGRMQFPDGEMSTRKGKVVKLEDVLDEAEKRAFQKIESHDSTLAIDDKRELARIIGTGAFKYNILSQNREQNYTFEWDKMLAFEGNSAPYLQYAYTRTQSLFRKAGDFSTAFSYAYAEKDERRLIKKLMQFPVVLGDALREYKPHLVCTYLHELSQAFSSFYNNVPILQAEPDTKNARLVLTDAFAKVLKRGLEILTIQVPQRM